MKQSYSCVPSSWIIPAVDFYGVCLMLFFAIKSFVENVFFAGLSCASIAVMCFIHMLWCWQRTMWKVQITHDCAICSAPFLKKIVIEYDKCTVGIDYSFVASGRQWWIYLCYGKPPMHEYKKPYNRMNAQKCKQGFIRVVFQREVYDRLLEVLPKKQRTALSTAARCAGLD